VAAQTGGTTGAQAAPASPIAAGTQGGTAGSNEDDGEPAHSQGEAPGSAGKPLPANASGESIPFKAAAEAPGAQAGSTQAVAQANAAQASSAANAPAANAPAAGAMGATPPTSAVPVSSSHTIGTSQPASTAEGAQYEPVPAQLATVLGPAAHQADGSYQVTIRLQPEDLGVVRVDLHLEAGTVNVSLHAEGDATRDMLRQNLGQLRQQLADAGLSTGRFDVSGGTSGGGSLAGQQQPSAAADEPANDNPGSTEAAAATDAAAVPVLTNGQLDMRL